MECIERRMGTSCTQCTVEIMILIGRHSKISTERVCRQPGEVGDLQIAIHPCLGSAGNERYALQVLAPYKVETKYCG